MEIKTLKTDIYKGYVYHIVQLETPYNTWVNGYIELNPGDPYYKSPYEEVDIPVNGGWTYAESYLNHDDLVTKEDNIWVIGFDTAHSWDGPDTQNLQFVESELHNAIDELNKKGSS